MRLARLALACVLCLCAGQALAWPRQFGPFAYVAADGGVAVVDIPTQKKTASIPLGDSSGPIAVTRDGTSVYVAYSKGAQTGTVAVIDAGSNAVKARIRVSGAPTAIFANARRNSVYIVHKSGAAGAETTSVAVIDVATNAVVADIAIGKGDIDVRAPSGGDWLVALNKSAGTLVKIDAKTNAIVATIPLGGLALAFDVRPDGLRAFVLRRRDDDGKVDLAVVNIPDAALFGNIDLYYAYPPDAYPLDLAAPAIVKIDDAGRAGVALVPILSRYKVVQTFYFSPDVWDHPTLGLPYYQAGDYAGTFSVLLFPGANVLTSLRPGFVDQYFNWDPVGGAELAGRPGQSAFTPDWKSIFIPVTSDQPGQTGLVIYPAFLIVGHYPTLIPFSRISGVAIVEPQIPQSFEKFGVAYLDVAHRASAGEDLFNFYGEITTTASFDSFRPDVAGMSVEVGAFTTTIPPGKFKKAADGSYVYNAWVNGVVYNAYVRPLGANKYMAHLLMRNAPLPQIANPAQVRLSFGNIYSGLQAAIATLR